MFVVIISLGTDKLKICIRRYVQVTQIGPVVNKKHLNLAFY